MVCSRGRERVERCGWDAKLVYRRIERCRGLRRVTGGAGAGEGRPWYNIVRIRRGWRREVSDRGVVKVAGR